MKNKLREIRLQKGLTLEDVAKAADTSNQQILRLEKGQRRLTTGWIERLSKALGVSPSEIVPTLSGVSQPDIQELIDNYTSASKEAQEAFLNMVRQLPKKSE